MDDVARVSAGAFHTMVVRTDGTLWAFGLNVMGQLGNGATTDRVTPNPTPAQVMTDVSKVSAGADHTLVVQTDGTLWAFGYNKSGHLGDGTMTDSTAPVYVMNGVADASAGVSHSMGLRTDGTLWGFGSHTNG